jgi:hypothetical protein
VDFGPPRPFPETPVAKPKLTSPTKFPGGLHKSMGHYDSARIYGTNIAAGDALKVKGSKGKKPTTWTGSIAKDNKDGSFDVTNLRVDHEEERKGKKKEDAGGGTEDVSVTVTNSTDTSDPVDTIGVTTIP